MRKNLLFLLFFCFVSIVPATAQFNFGIKAGVNLAQKPTTNINEFKDNLKGSTGWFVGPAVKLTLPSLGLGVEADILYSQTKVEIEGQNITTQSVDIPLYLRFDLKLPIITPFVAIGPQFGWNIGEKVFTLKNLKSGDDLKYTLNNSDISLNLGVGFILLNHLQLHGNYNLALGHTAEISKQNFTDIANATELKTSKWQISVTYLF